MSVCSFAYHKFVQKSEEWTRLRMVLEGLERESGELRREFSFWFFWVQLGKWSSHVEPFLNIDDGGPKLQIPKANELSYGCKFSPTSFSADTNIAHSVYQCIMNLGILTESWA